ELHHHDSRPRRQAHRLPAAAAAHRVPLHSLRRAPRARVRRRPAADRAALVQQRRGAQVRSRGAVVRRALAALFVFTVSFAAAALAADQKATFAGGCFWCMQPAYDAVPGVVSTTVGYTGGHTKDPSYHEVGAGGTGHAESIEVEYDPSKVSYEKLLEVF